jgi:hypothetical protein
LCGLDLDVSVKKPAKPLAKGQSQSAMDAGIGPRLIAAPKSLE